MKEMMEDFPKRVKSNINGGVVSWSGASYMNLLSLLLLVMLAYPAMWLAFIFTMTLLISCCMFAWGEKEGKACEVGGQRGGDHQPTDDTAAPAQSLPVVRVQDLAPLSRQVYAVWVTVCRAIPLVTVFGMPVVLACASRHRPLEVFLVLTLINSAVLFTNLLHWTIFVTQGYLGICREEAAQEEARAGRIRRKVDGGEVDAEEKQAEAELFSVMHWVILPQYKEELETVAMAVESVAQSRLAMTSINILLAMEEREAAAQEKVDALKARFDGRFCDIMATFHPADLPDDPAGKASNVAWAFKTLRERLQGEGKGSANVVLTVADADSEFHGDYFELLAKSFLRADHGAGRHLTLWQSPVLHLKNYHRQPMPVLVCSVITLFGETSCLADPNGVRLPYSTYSLSFDLAHRVGGWDPQWIAEDWHMGIKCFLYSRARTRVVPLMLPTLNYTPEEDSYWGTISARWTQAKRHALGFSDLAYYFMTLPLVLWDDPSPSAERRSGVTTRIGQAASMVWFGLAIAVKLFNIHVLLGIGILYAVVNLALGLLMQAFFAEDRLLSYFLDRANFCPGCLVAAGGLCAIWLVFIYVVVYNHLKHRIDSEEKDRHSWAFKHPVLHYLYVYGAIQTIGPFVLMGLTLATWKAAWKTMVESSFEYEVASKPTKANRLST